MKKLDGFNNLPELVSPNKNELYMQWCDQEWNLWAGCNGSYNGSIQTNHWSWLFKSINALNKGDICLFGGDYVIFGDGSSSSDDGKYFTGGINKALVNAMKRGAKILSLTDRYYTGGVDGAGKSVSCSNTQKPWSRCSSNSALCWKTGLYCQENGWCAGCTMGKYGFDPTAYGSLAYQAAEMKTNETTSTYNFISYDIPGKNGDTTHPHTHVKLISFYYASTNRFSVFKGGWNLSTWKMADNLKETGMGLTGVLSDPIGQLLLWGDYGHLLALENNSAHPFYVYTPKGKTIVGWYGKDINPIKVSDYLKKKFLSSDSPPPQPLVIPTVYFMGPSFGKNVKNFGCGAVNSGRTQYFSCSSNEDWIKITDTDVRIALGYDPMPQGVCRQEDKKAAKDLKQTLNGCWQNDGIGDKKWSKLGNNWPSVNPDTFNAVDGKPQSGFPWGMDVIVDFINSSKYLKTLMHSQLIGTGTDDTTSGVVGIFYQTIINFCKNKPWYTITNPDNIDNSTSIGANVTSKNWYHRFYTGCTLKPGIINTHDKLWISDIGFILGSGHPQMMHYNQFLTNCELLVTNAPGLTSYMNNHFNAIYAKSESEYANLSNGTTADIRISDLCPKKSQDGVCITKNMSLAPRNGWETFSDMPLPPPPPPSPGPSPGPNLAWLWWTLSSISLIGLIILVILIVQKRIKL